MKSAKALMIEAAAEPQSPVESLLVTAVIQLAHDLEIMSCRVQELERLARLHKSPDKEGA